MKSRLKIFMASSVHPWNDVRVYYKEALSLTKIAEVQLLAVKVPGLSQVPNDGVAVELLPASGSTPGKAASFLLRIRRIGLVIRGVMNRKYDVFHFHDPELIPVGWLAKLRGSKVVYDVHEDCKSLSEIRKWLPRGVMRILGTLGRAFERLSLRIFDRFILAEITYKDFFPSRKCQVVQNYINLGTSPRATHRESDQPLKLVYAGALTTGRGALDMLTAAKELRCNGINVTLDLYGNVTDIQVRELILEYQSENWLTWHGPVPYPLLVEKLPEYHVGLSPLRDCLNYRYSLPTKLLDYMAAGLAIVASNLPRTADIVNHDAGAVLHDPGNAIQLRECIQLLLHEPTRLGLAQSSCNAISKYSWDTQEQALLQVYSEMVGEVI